MNRVFYALMAISAIGCGVAYAQPTGTADGGTAARMDEDVRDGAPSDATPSDATTTVDAEADATAAGGRRESVQDSAGIDQLLLEGRCKTAICLNAFDRRNWLGIEPLVELPIGKTFTFNTGGLADYVNNNDITVKFTAGLRVWFFKDWVSLGIYLSQPITPKDSQVRIPGSEFAYPASYVRRPYPGFALGFLFDVLWLGIDRDELRNGTSDDSAARDPSFPRNALVSGVWTFTLALQPFTTFRTGLGTVVSKSDSDSRKTLEEENKKLKTQLEAERAKTDAGTK